MNEDQNKQQQEPPERIWRTSNGYVYKFDANAKAPEGGVEYVRADLAQPPRTYHCSCSAALTAEEYIHHYFELEHDRGDLAPPDVQRIAERIRSVNTPPECGDADCIARHGPISSDYRSSSNGNL